MKEGKVSESILKRSVFRQIKATGNEKIKGAGIGMDCAFLSWMEPAVSTQTITLPVPNSAYLAVMAAANNLAAAGAEAAAATLAVTLPLQSQEAELRQIMEQAERACDQLGICVVGGHTEVSRAVHTPVITATAVGKRESSCEALQGNPEELDLVLTKWIGLEATSLIAAEREKELTVRYPLSLIRRAAGFEVYLSVASEAAIARKSGVYAMHDVRNGGIFGALWELSRKLGVGLTVDLQKIPVKQETVEICEFYDLNPYELLSGGCLLIAASNGEKLVEELAACEIEAALIGRTQKGNDKLIVNHDEIRYLEPVKPDEIWKLKAARAAE